MPPRLRRPHRKSKSGCKDCRRRRVKCDEERPKCRNCLRRCVACEYDLPDPEDQALSRGSPLSTQGRYRDEPQHHPTPQSQPEAATSTPASTHAAAAAAALTNSAAGAETLEMSALVLLHHWTVSTSVDMFKAPAMTNHLQVTFPEIGFEHPFVLHAILSLAALHLAHIGRDPKNNSILEGSRYIIEATNHHSLALRGFQQELECMTTKNCEALFTWTTLNFIYVMAVTNRPRNSDGGSRPNDFSPGETTASQRISYTDHILGADWIPITRGVSTVLAPLYEYIKVGRMKDILSLGNFDELDPDAEEFRTHLSDERLRALSSIWNDNADAGVYDEALWILRRSNAYTLQFDWMDEETLSRFPVNRAWTGPLLFIYIAPQAYFTLLQQRQPPALILLCYFGALLHRLTDYWFLEGWGRNIVEVVDELLGSYWRDRLLWPLEEVGLA